MQRRRGNGKVTNGLQTESKPNGSSKGHYNPIAKIHDELNTEECRRLLMKVDKMREILQMEKISLPQIVVVGDQSVGKSSILEAISGVELPRAQNICTRCPLELRMKHAPEGTPDYATIRCAGTEEVTIHDLSETSTNIIALTNFLTGNTLNISASPIHLTVYKKEIQDDLTLIDLPGITRIHVDGQSPTICQDIISLIEMYVKEESAIVLHVIPSSTDFTTSESIRICQRYDPNFERQIIAVSKIDKHDKGIGEKLQGIGSGAIFLQLGCVAVLNRNQQEIDDKISFAEMRQREEDFFRTNPAFHDVPQEFLGSTALIKKLVIIQQDRIRSTLPRVIEQVEHRIITAQDELRRIPPSISSENQARIAFNEILRNYRIAIEQRVRGDYEIDTKKNPAPFDPRAHDKWDDRIAYHFKKIGEFTSKQIKKILNDFTATDMHVEQLIQDNYGGGLPNFPSSNIIQQLYQPYHRKIQEPCKQIVLWVENYIICCLSYILENILPADANFRAALMRELGKTIQSAIKNSKENCMTSVERMLQMEERVFTVNPRYMELYSTMSQNRPSSAIGHDVWIGLQAYCSIVHVRIVDHLSQLIDYWFIQNGVMTIDTSLHKAFSPIDLFKLMKDSTSLEQKRTSLQRTIDVMQRALAAAQED